MREGIRALVRDAIAAGELRPCDALRVARVLHATLNGSMLDWVIHREGAMAPSIRRDLTDGARSLSRQRRALTKA